MINHIRILDDFGVPDNLTDADAEYVRINLARTQLEAVAEKRRAQLSTIESILDQQHRALVKKSNKRSR